MALLSYKCDCGYVSEILNLEKDSPFSSIEIWVFHGFLCKQKEVERKGFLTFDNAVDIAEAKCPKCSVKLSSKNINK